MNIWESFASCSASQVLDELMLLMNPDEDKRRAIYAAHEKALSAIVKVEPMLSDGIFFIVQNGMMTKRVLTLCCIRKQNWCNVCRSLMI